MFFLKKNNSFRKNENRQEPVFKPIRVLIVSSSDSFLAAETLLHQLQKNNFFEILPDLELIEDTFFNFNNKNFFDFLDTGLKISKKREADILIWVYIEKNKVRLNFQTPNMYKKFNPPFFSLLDTIYLPAFYFNKNELPNQILTLIMGMLIIPCFSENKTYAKKLEHVLNVLSKEKFPKDMDVSFKPYVLKNLASVYFSTKIDDFQKKDLTTLLNLISICIKDSQKEYDNLLSGSLYALLGQIYHAAYFSNLSESYVLIKKSIESYKTAQKHFNKYIFPYDYGRLSFILSDLYFRFFNLLDDQQALRDCVFHLRQAEKVFTMASNPFLWAEIEGRLGQCLSVLASTSDNEEIALLAVQNLKNKQKVYHKKFDLASWRDTEIEIGNIYYYLGKRMHYEKYLEESITHYNEAFNASIELNQNDQSQKIEGYINKAEEEIMFIAN